MNVTPEKQNSNLKRVIYGELNSNNEETDKEYSYVNEDSVISFIDHKGKSLLGDSKELTHGD